MTKETEVQALQRALEDEYFRLALRAFCLHNEHDLHARIVSELRVAEPNPQKIAQMTGELGVYESLIPVLEAYIAANL